MLEVRGRFLDDEVASEVDIVAAVLDADGDILLRLLMRGFRSGGDLECSEGESLALGGVVGFCCEGASAFL